MKTHKNNRFLKRSCWKSTLVFDQLGTSTFSSLIAKLQCFFPCFKEKNPLLPLTSSHTKTCWIRALHRLYREAKCLDLPAWLQLMLFHWPWNECTETEENNGVKTHPGGSASPWEERSECLLFGSYSSPLNQVGWLRQHHLHLLTEATCCKPDSPEKTKTAIVHLSPLFFPLN